MANARLLRIRARKPKKIPPRAVRFTKSPQTPRAVELSYVLACQKLAARWGTRAEALLLPIAKRVIKPAEDTRADAADDGPYDSALSSLGSYGGLYADGTEFASAQVLTAKKAVTHSKAEFQRIGVKLRQAEPNLDKGIRQWRSDNVDLVKTMFDKQKDILGDILTGYEGHSYDTIAKQIAERCSVVSSRAEFIARDQVLKLNSNITTARMGAAGVSEFIWTTTGDDRVRPMHEDLDGQQFSFDDPPVTNDDGDENLPGEDYQCRCVPTPVLPEFDDDDATNDNQTPEDAPEDASEPDQTPDEPTLSDTLETAAQVIEDLAAAKEVEAPLAAALEDIAPALPPDPSPLPPEATLARPGAKVDVLAQKVGEASGSNPGGIYIGSDGVKRYVKFYKDPAQAVGEHLANSLYGDLGLGGVKSLVFEHEGGLAYASEILPDVHTLGSQPITKALAKKALNGFAADVLTANWDAAGLNLDNMLVDAKGGITRIDNGGSFLTRAQGARKPLELLSQQITEWQTFFDPTKNSAYAKLAAKAGVTGPADLAASIKSSVKKIIKVRDEAGGWAKYVAERAESLSVIDRDRIVAMLDARTTFLEQRAAEFPKVVRKAKAAVSALPGPIVDSEITHAKDAFAAKVHSAAEWLRLHPGLPDLYDYTGSGYRAMNTALAKAGGVTSELGEAARRIEQTQSILLDAAKSGHAIDGVVYRGLGVSDKVLANFLASDDLKFVGFTSTSVSQDVSLRFSQQGGPNRVMFRIRQRSAIPIDRVSANPGEGEALLPHGLQFKVLAKSSKNGITWIDLHQL